MEGTIKISNLILRLMALCYLAAFVSLYKQLGILIGTSGLLPARDMIKVIESRNLSFFDAPSIFGFKSSLDDYIDPILGVMGLENEDKLDSIMYIAGIAGVGLSFLASISSKLCTRAVFLILWLLYLSFVTIGGEFFRFQWDILLLEVVMAY